MNKKDAGLIAGFALFGVAIAWFATGPLRHSTDDTAGAPAEETARLQQEAPAPQLYAEGVVELAAGFKPEAPALFIIARPASGGPPVAVKRVANPTFPVSFSLSMADSMMGGDPYMGDLTIIARLDKDGSAGPVQPGDVESVANLPMGAPRTLRLVLPPSST